MDKEILALDLYNSLEYACKDLDIKLPEDISVKAKKYRKIIDDLIKNNKSIPKDKIEEIQDFADMVEVLLLHNVRNRMLCYKGVGNKY